MFDPEKVDRWTDWERRIDDEIVAADAVAASDYDKLLELYREAKQKADTWADAYQYAYETD